MSVQPLKKQITFQVFLKAIEHVATLAYPNLNANAAIQHVMKLHFDKVLNSDRVNITGYSIKEQL